MKALDIGEVAAQSGLPASTLRFYEEKGLITASGRHGLRRQYHPNVVQRLAVISLGRSAGFSLNQIATMFGQDGKVRIRRAMLASKAEELERSIRQLTALRNGLRHAAACPAADHLECPTFLRLLKAATRRKRSS